MVPLLSTARKMCLELPLQPLHLVQLAAAGRKAAAHQCRQRQQGQMPLIWMSGCAAAIRRQAVCRRQPIDVAAAAVLTAQMGSTRGRAWREISVAGCTAH